MLSATYPQNLYLKFVNLHLKKILTSKFGKVLPVGDGLDLLLRGGKLVVRLVAGP